MTETNRPEISVVMPAYNHEMYVAEAIESVLLQTFKNFELIIINDGSTDGTEDVIKKYSDPRIQYYYQENGGSHDAINKGISLSRGDFVSIINSDDVFYCNRLEVLLHTAKTEALDFLVTAITLIDAASNIISDPAQPWVKWYEKLKNTYRDNKSSLRAILIGNYTISTSNFFIRRTLFNEIGTLTNLRYVLDYEFAIRAMRRDEGKFRFLVDTELLFYRMHGKNTILSDTVSAHIEAYELVTETIKHIFGEEISPFLDHLKEMTYGIKAQRVGYEDFAAQLLRERYIIRDSFSHKLGKFLTLRSFKEKKCMTVKDIQSLKAAIESYIDDIAIVSFNLFDTVFNNLEEHTERIKSTVSERISKHLRNTCGIYVTPAEISTIRGTIELTHRQNSLNTGADFECSYRSIVQDMSKQILGRLDEKLVNKVITFEIMAEQEAISVMDDIVPLLRWIQSKDKKIIAVSDTCLDKDILWEILGLKSLTGVFKYLYLSSEKGLSKTSGSLFKHVLFSEKVLSESVLHIGSHKTTDYKVPISLGFKVIRFYDSPT